MATFTNFGYDPDFLFSAFYTETGGIELASITSTRAELLNPETGARTILTGTGLSPITVGGQPSLAGTVTGISIITLGGPGASGDTTFTVTGISWNATTLIAATTALVDDDNPAPLDALLNRQTIVYDASDAVQGVSAGFSGVSVTQTITGSRYDDEIVGGTGNDTINPGGPEGETFAYDIITASRGNDTYDLRDAGYGNFAEFDYSVLTGPITVTLNGTTGNGTIAKSGNGTDTFIGVRQAMLADGVGIVGTQRGDVFNIIGVGDDEDSYAFVAGGQGNDTYNLTLNGTVRIGFHYDNLAGPTTGVTANLATGAVSRDGFGGVDQINILGGTGTLEVEGTRSADSFTGSARDERFLVRGGNDTIVGGGGFDSVRFDRNGATSGINGSLETGIVTGSFNNIAFTATLTDIDLLRGTNLDDRLVAKSTGSWLNGRGGNDTLVGSNSYDNLFGYDGNDLLQPGWNDGDDDIDAGAGIDEIQFTAGPATGPNATFTIQNGTLSGPIQLTINGTGARNGLITKGSEGETRLTNVHRALADATLQVLGTGYGDSFTAQLSTGESLNIRSGQGADTFNISGTGEFAIVLSRDGYGDFATQGAVINMATGVVANDGYGTSDTLTLGTDLDLTVVGTRLADSVTGGTRAFRFVTMGGNDTVTGGTGFETLSYWDDDDQHSAAVRVDLAAGRARGVFETVAFDQRFTGIEGAEGTLDFGDVLAGARTANSLSGFGGNDDLYGDGFRAGYSAAQAAQVYRLYQATLDRAPDTAGQADWTMRLFEGTQTLAQVAAGFVASVEFQRVYGALNNTQFVTQLYRNVLDRDPDATGLANWVNQLNGGTSRAQVVLGLSESREFVTKTQADANAFAVARVEAGWTDDVFRLYRATLDREPDAAGFGDWIGRLAGGTSFLSAVTGFIGGREFQNTYGALNNEAFVTLLYQNVLDRAPDAAGLANWLSRMAAGTTRAQVVEGFAQGREFVNATAAGVADFVRRQGIHDTLEGGSGDNDLWGGMLSDMFVFSASDDGSNRIGDFEAWDVLFFDGFGYDDTGDVRAHLRQDGANVVFQDQGVTVVVANTQLSAISDAALDFA